MRISNVFCILEWTAVLFAAVCGIEVGVSSDIVHAGEPVKGAAKQIDLGCDVTLEIVFIPPGEFKMGSTAAEKKWAVGQDGGALFSSGGGAREAYEGEPRPMRVKDGFWMGRTEVSVGQFRRFVDETGYISDAEEPGGTTKCFGHNWKPNISNSGTPPHPWVSMEDKSWRDPNHGTDQKENFPVVCVSYNDMKAFCAWLTKKEREVDSLPDGLIYRLPTEAEWAYACRGGRLDSSYYWWGNDLNDAKGRLNISGIDFLPGKDYVWTGAKLPWSVAGGPIKRGYVHGSSDRMGAYPADKPVTPADLAATIFTLFGVPPTTNVYDPGGRPFHIAEGRLVDGLLA